TATTEIYTLSLHDALPISPAAAPEKGDVLTRIQVIMGSTRAGRFSERVATWVLEYLTAYGPFEVELVDLRDYPLPFFDQEPPARTLRDDPNRDIARLGRKLD